MEQDSWRRRVTWRTHVTHRIEFTYDIVSPYSYFGFTILSRYIARWSDVEITFTPAFLGGVFAATRNAPPATLPARAPYLVRDLGRCGAYYALPVLLPPNFPSKTVRAIRAMTALKAMNEPAYRDTIAAFFDRYWARGEAWHDTEEEVLEVLLGMQSAPFSEGRAKEIVSMTNDDAIKDSLKAATAAAVDRGAFGFPAIFATKDGDTYEQLYFGADRLDVMAFEFGLPWSGPVPERARD